MLNLLLLSWRHIRSVCVDKKRARWSSVSSVTQSPSNGHHKEAIFDNVFPISLCKTKEKTESNQAPVCSINAFILFENPGDCGNGGASRLSDRGTISKWSGHDFKMNSTSHNNVLCSVARAPMILDLSTSHLAQLLFSLLLRPVRSTCRHVAAPAPPQASSRSP